MQRIVIFGATSAIATACARMWVARGQSLYLVGRNKAKLESLLADLRVRAASGQRLEGIGADLNEFDGHEDLFNKAMGALGSIDVILIAHGSLPDQKACENSAEMTLKEIQTNALSVISLLTHAANRLEKQGCGTIAVISSVAGDRGRGKNYVYGTAKGAVSLFLQGLRNRLAVKKIGVVTIKPGFVDTPMTAGFDKKGALWAKPEDIAKGIVNGIEQQRSVVYLPWIWRWIMFIIRHIPETIFKRLSL
jgi:decaprenylphospho-beta-D-erythro-pentofuranosid-2-ulose 2-reductase